MKSNYFKSHLRKKKHQRLIDHHPHLCIPSPLLVLSPSSGPPLVIVDCRAKLCSLLIVCSLTILHFQQSKVSPRHSQQRLFTFSKSNTAKSNHDGRRRKTNLGRRVARHRAYALHPHQICSLHRHAHLLHHHRRSPHVHRKHACRNRDKSVGQLDRLRESYVKIARV